jgi:predicted DNA-binding protein (MmcQ/YjbR family)
MDLEVVRKHCLSFPHVTEDIKWGNDLAFCVAKKMFVVIDVNPPHSFSFKCTPEEFAELTQRNGIRPADYVARYHWVTVDHHDSLRLTEIKQYLRKSYDLVYGKLPKSAKAKLKK